MACAKLPRFFVDDAAVEVGVGVVGEYGGEVVEVEERLFVASDVGICHRPVVVGGEIGGFFPNGFVEFADRHFVLAFLHVHESPVVRLPGFELAGG